MAKTDVFGIQLRMGRAGGSEMASHTHTQKLDDNNLKKRSTAEMTMTMMMMMTVTNRAAKIYWYIYIG